MLFAELGTTVTNMPNETSHRISRKSIIIPTYNRSHLLQALESDLAINYANGEIVVPNNASTDSTRSVVESYLRDDRLPYVRRKQNIGMIRSWQRALHEDISGEWFATRSDDDYFIDSFECEPFWRAYGAKL